MMDEFTELKKTGIGGCIVRFRTGPMPADFAKRGLQLFMKDIAPAIRRAHARRRCEISVSSPRKAGTHTRPSDVDVR